MGLLLSSSSSPPIDTATSLPASKNSLKHIAIIPDGNRRWAIIQRKNIAQGHSQGAEQVMEITRLAKELQISYISFYLFSTENWSRHPFEVETILCLLEKFLLENREEMEAMGVAFQTIGDLSKFPHSLQHVLQETKEMTASGSHMQLIFALNYGARNELCRAVSQLLRDQEEGKIDFSEVDERLIASYLDTQGWPDPDLLIRTGGELRISNYLLWQLSYAELYMTDCLWPNFGRSEFLAAIHAFHTRKRRFGGG